jgi:DNA invertase Pin-like site-specific DNA recombinase
MIKLLYSCRPAGVIAAIYARVSTEDQSYDMQLTELRAYAKRMGWEVVEYQEKASSVKKRPQFDRMMADARLKKFDIVLVWAVDRFARSIKQLLDMVLELDRVHVRFVAMTQNIDSDEKNPMGRFMLTLFGALAQLERDMILKRVQAGIREAKRKGVHCGRPKKVFRRDQVIELHQQGLSQRAIARHFGVDKNTIRDVLRGGEKVSPKAA